MPEKCRLVVCGDTCTHRKRHQRSVDRLWNGQIYHQKPRDHDTPTLELLDMIEKANRDHFQTQSENSGDWA